MSSNANLSALLSGFKNEETEVTEEDIVDVNEDEIINALLNSKRVHEDERAVLLFSDYIPAEPSSSSPIVPQEEEQARSELSQKNVVTGLPAQKSLDMDKRRQQFAPTDHAVFDPAFGIRIRNPKITLHMLNTYCHDMKKIRAGSIRRLGAPSSGEWATMAVIVSKTDCRKSANNKEYIIWQVSDLMEIQDTPIKVLLFGDCVKQHWKLQAGMTVMLVNPSLADGESSKQMTLKVAKAAQVVDIGFCPDLGTCKALKADGSSCSIHVNITKTEYCVYHMQNAARKLSARRGTFGSSSNIPPKAYRTPTTAPVEPMPDGLKTTSRGGPLRKFVKAIPRHMKLSKTFPVAGSPATQSQRSSPTPDQLLRNRSGTRKRGESFDPQQLSEPPIKRVKSMKEFIHSQENKPNLGSRAKLGFVDLASPEKKMKSRTELHEQSKLKKAAEILRRTATQPADKQGACRKLANCDDVTSTSKFSFTDDQITALMSRKSKFHGEAAEALQDRQNRYFADREVEEKVESSATSLMEIKNCKVVTCVACDYTSVHQSEYCRSLGHLVKRHTADKRFFRCKNCKTRISCFKILPTKPCQSCLMIDYERVAMRDERKIHEEKLLLRGEERKFIN